MTVFTATLSQTAFLFLFILLGFVLVRMKAIPDASGEVLSGLENTVFIPALVLSTFLEHFRAEKIERTWKLLLFSLGLALIFLLISLILSRFLAKDPYEKNLYTFGLCFSNFGFMGNAVVAALFPDIFLDYLIFTLPLWSLIYLWGVPTLLLADGKKRSPVENLKRFLNPMFLCTLLGMLLGPLSLPIPSFVESALSAAGSCMSPVAMLLTGIVIARYNVKDLLSIRGVYVTTGIRLLIYPLAFLGVLALLPIPRDFATCAVASLAMPLGLSTIVIPASLGKDTRVAAGMALVSHVLSCLTIPIIFTLFQFILP